MYLRREDVDDIVAGLDLLAIRIWKLQAAVRGLRKDIIETEIKDTKPMVAFGEPGAVLRPVQGFGGGGRKR